MLEKRIVNVKEWKTQRKELIDKMLKEGKEYLTIDKNDLFSKKEKK